MSLFQKSLDPIHSLNLQASYSPLRSSPRDSHSCSPPLRLASAAPLPLAWTMLCIALSSATPRQLCIVFTVPWIDELLRLYWLYWLWTSTRCTWQPWTELSSVCCASPWSPWRLSPQDSVSSIYGPSWWEQRLKGALRSLQWLQLLSLHEWSDTYLRNPLSGLLSQQAIECSRSCHVAALIQGHRGDLHSSRL